MLSLVHMPLAPLDNGRNAALLRPVQLQMDTQCVGVHHVPHSEACDAGSPKTPTVHRVFEMPLERLVSVFCRNTAKNVQTPKATRKIPHVPKGPHPIAVYPNTPLNGHSRNPIP